MYLEASGNFMSFRVYFLCVILILTFYACGQLYFTLHLNLSGMDALYISTSALTLCGKYTSNSNEVNSSVGFIGYAGGLFSLCLLNIFVWSDVQDAKAGALKFATSGKMSLKLVIQRACIRRLVYPIGHFICVLSVGALFFSVNEKWPITTALHYCIKFKTAGNLKSRSCRSTFIYISYTLY